VGVVGADRLACLLDLLVQAATLLPGFVESFLLADALGLRLDQGFQLPPPLTEGEARRLVLGVLGFQTALLLLQVARQSLKLLDELLQLGGLLAEVAVGVAGARPIAPGLAQLAILGEFALPALQFPAQLLAALLNALQVLQGDLGGPQPATHLFQLRAGLLQGSRRALVAGDGLAGADEPRIAGCHADIGEGVEERDQHVVDLSAAAADQSLDALGHLARSEDSLILRALFGVLRETVGQAEEVGIVDAKDLTDQPLVLAHGLSPARGVVLAAEVGFPGVRRGGVIRVMGTWRRYPKYFVSSEIAPDAMPAIAAHEEHFALESNRAGPVSESCRAPDIGVRTFR
jgi:hypothetical protein